MLRPSNSVMLTISCIYCLLHFEVLFVSAASLKQLHVITRHGSRPPLSKDASTLSENGGETLTPLGQQQLFNLGRWLRDQYAMGDFLKVYDHKMDRLESSNLDRTLTSANSLSIGVFPEEAKLGGNSDQFFQSSLPHAPAIPIFSRQEKNDVYIRAYHNCPRFNRNLEKLYTSRVWTSLEESSQSLLQNLAEKLRTQLDNSEASRIALKDAWNYYDPIHVARTECSPDPTSFACQSSVKDPNIRQVLSDEEFAELESLVHQTEQLKYSLSTAESLLGSNLLWQILDRSTKPGRFFLYSAHAPTILGLLSTLKEWDIGETFIDYGSAIVVEVYEEPSQEISIQIVYKSSSNPISIPLNLDEIDCGEKKLDEASCPLQNVIRWAEKNSHKTIDDWCKACENISSDVCLRSGANPWTLFEAEMHPDEAEVILGTFFGGFGSGLIFMFLCVTFCNAFCGRKQSELSVSSNKRQPVDPSEVSPQGFEEVNHIENKEMNLPNLM